MTVLEELEQIDDDCDKHGIQFVKIDDSRSMKEFGISSVMILILIYKFFASFLDSKTFSTIAIFSSNLTQLCLMKNLFNRFLPLFIMRNKCQMYMMAI